MVQYHLNETYLSVKWGAGSLFLSLFRLTPWEAKIL